VLFCGGALGSFVMERRHCCLVGPNGWLYFLIIGLFDLLFHLKGLWRFSLSGKRGRVSDVIRLPGKLLELSCLFWYAACEVAHFRRPVNWSSVPQLTFLPLIASTAAHALVVASVSALACPKLPMQGRHVIGCSIFFLRLGLDSLVWGELL